MAPPLLNHCLQNQKVEYLYVIRTRSIIVGRQKLNSLTFRLWFVEIQATRPRNTNKDLINHSFDFALRILRNWYDWDFNNMMSIWSKLRWPLSEANWEFSLLIPYIYKIAPLLLIWIIWRGNYLLCLSSCSCTYIIVWWFISFHTLVKAKYIMISRD